MTKEKITRFTLNPDDPPPASLSDLARLDSLRDEDIDCSDIPELTDEFWKNGRFLKPAKG